MYFEFSVSQSDNKIILTDKVTHFDRLYCSNLDHIGLYPMRTTLNCWRVGPLKSVGICESTGP